MNSQPVESGCRRGGNQDAQPTPVLLSAAARPKCRRHANPIEPTPTASSLTSAQSTYGDKSERRRPSGEPGRFSAVTRFGQAEIAAGAEQSMRKRTIRMPSAQPICL
jgi:hypothetical protein